MKKIKLLLLLILSLPYSYCIAQPTLNAGTINLEWFGCDYEGPNNDMLQRQLAAQLIITHLQLDLAFVQEFSVQNDNENLFRTELQNINPDYELIVFEHNTNFNGNNQCTQFRALVYNTNVVTDVSGQVISAIEDNQVENTVGDPGEAYNYVYGDSRAPIDISFTWNGDVFIAILVHEYSGWHKWDARKESAKLIRDYLNLTYSGPAFNHNVLIVGDFNDNVSGWGSPSITYPSGCSDGDYECYLRSPYLWYALHSTPGWKVVTDAPFNQPLVTTFVGGDFPIDHVILSGRAYYDYFVSGSVKRIEPATYGLNHSQITDHYPVVFQLREQAMASPDRDLVDFQLLDNNYFRIKSDEQSFATIQKMNRYLDYYYSDRVYNEIFINPRIEETILNSEVYVSDEAYLNAMKNFVDLSHADVFHIDLLTLATTKIKVESTTQTEILLRLPSNLGASKKFALKVIVNGKEFTRQFLTK